MTNSTPDLINRSDVLTIIKAAQYDCGEIDLIDTEVVEEIIDPIKALPSVNSWLVKVKPLVWVLHPSVPIWRCDTIVGTYKVFAMEPFPTWDFDSATNPKDKLSTRAETPEAAKSAAQAHHDAAIRAEIILTPDPRDDVIARLVELADRVATGTHMADPLHRMANNALAAAREFLK